ncbi:MAG: 30S ribosomal protein S17e [Nanoarchaeota archaeon]|nr:30S ribosomal protein S17e [Nanoarchaeota archaeon]
MGRIKTKKVKKVTDELVRLHGDKFKEDFDSNKLLVSELATVPSKKLRNIIAGYVTRQIRQKKHL